MAPFGNPPPGTDAARRRHHDRALRSAFTAQADGFNRSGAANDATLLDALLAHAAPATSQTWLEAACGPGVISRHLAPRVRAVYGVDLTPAMVELARESAAAAGVENASFAAVRARARRRRAARTARAAPPPSPQPRAAGAP